MNNKIHKEPNGAGSIEGHVSIRDSTLRTMKCCAVQTEKKQQNVYSVYCTRFEATR